MFEPALVQEQLGSEEFNEALAPLFESLKPTCECPIATWDDLYCLSNVDTKWEDEIMRVESREYDQYAY